jgi:phosphoglucomutase
MLIAKWPPRSDENKTLYDLLQELYQRYGYAAEQTISIALEGKEGVARIKAAMAFLREHKTGRRSGVPVRPYATT